MYEVKTKDVYEDLARIKKIVFQMKDQDDIEKSGGVAIEKSVVWCQICIPFRQMIVVRTRKAKGVSRNVVAAISHNQYKDFFLNKKCFRQSKNRFRNKDHRIATYEFNKTYFLCFDNKIHIQNIGNDVLAHGYQS